MAVSVSAGASTTTPGDGRIITTIGGDTMSLGMEWGTDLGSEVGIADLMIDLLTQPVQIPPPLLQCREQDTRSDNQSQWGEGRAAIPLNAPDE